MWVKKRGSFTSSDCISEDYIALDGAVASERNSLLENGSYVDSINNSASDIQLLFYNQRIEFGSRR